MLLTNPMIIQFLTLMFWLFDLAFSANLYVSPEKNTGLKLGTQSQPFDSILEAFSNSNTGDSIFLMKTASGVSDHYLLLTDDQDKILNAQTIYQVPKISIQSLYCADTSKCFQEGEKATIFLKSYELIVYISEGLAISNVIIDGSEAISTFNSLNESLNARACSTSRSRCCSEVKDGLSIIYQDVACKPINSSAYLSSNVSNSLFLIEDDSIEFNISDSIIQNVGYYEIQSLVDARGSENVLSWSSVTFDNVYHYAGLYTG